MTSLSLSSLIEKSDWRGVDQRLKSKPEEASIVVPTNFKGTTYALHRAICVKTNPIPRKILLVLVHQFPSALDLNVFIGACENPQLSNGSMEILLDRSNNEIYQTVQCNAQILASKAVQNKNVHTVHFFIERFPNILNDEILLIHACKCGTPEIVEKILAAGLRYKVGKAGGLFRKNYHKEDALDVAIKCYDEKDDNSRYILVTCLQYANAAKIKMEAPHPDYPVILAALGLVPPQIFRSFLKLYRNEITDMIPAERYAILKGIKIKMKDRNDHMMPYIFKSRILINACRNRDLELVHRLLNESIHKACEDFSEELIEASNTKTDITKNALDVALELLDGKNRTSRKILKICIQYANAAKLGIKSPPSNYPTILAAVGFFPERTMHKIVKAYQYEVVEMCENKNMFAFKRVIKMVYEDVKYAIRLDSRCLYPLSTNARRLRLKRNPYPLQTILSERYLVNEEEGKEA